MCGVRVCGVCVVFVCVRLGACSGCGRQLLTGMQMVHSVTFNKALFVVTVPA